MISAIRPQSRPQQLEPLRDMVGNTPLLAITFRYKRSVRTLYAKAEYLNLTGSIKDRMALHILCSAYEDGLLKPGEPIIEATSGNTGIALAAIATAMGHPVIIYMPDWMSRERVELIRSYRAKIQSNSIQDGVRRELEGPPSPQGVDDHRNHWNWHSQNQRDQVRIMDPFRVLATCN